MSIVDRLEKLVALNNNSDTPLLSGSVGVKVLTREETTELGSRVIDAIKNFDYERLTVQNSPTETRVTFVTGHDYSTLSFAKA